MSHSNGTRNAAAITYLVLYVASVLWALTTSSGAGGGMAFVLPIILGIPWSLLLGVLLLVLPIPKSLMIMLLIVVAPALNVLLILRTSGFVRSKRD